MFPSLQQLLLRIYLSGRSSDLGKIINGYQPWGQYGQSQHGNFNLLNTNMNDPYLIDMDIISDRAKLVKLLACLSNDYIVSRRLKNIMCPESVQWFAPDSVHCLTENAEIKIHPN